MSCSRGGWSPPLDARFGAQKGAGKSRVCKAPKGAKHLHAGPQKRARRATQAQNPTPDPHASTQRALRTKNPQCPKAHVPEGTTECPDTHTPEYTESEVGLWVRAGGQSEGAVEDDK